MGKGYIGLSPEELKELLAMPKEWDIDAIEYHAESGHTYIYFSGPDIPPRKEDYRSVRYYRSVKQIYDVPRTVVAWNREQQQGAT